MAAQTFLKLLPLVLNTTYPEVKLITKLNNFFDFDHNVFLLETSTNINRFVGIQNVEESTTPRSVCVFNTTIGSEITGMETRQEISSKNTFMIVALKSSEFEINLKFLTRIKAIQALHFGLKIGVFLSDSASSEDIRKIFEWSWKNRIINIFIVTYAGSERLNLFSFNPFGTFNVINVTSDETYDNYFLRQDTNFQQYPLRLGATFRWASDQKFWFAIFQVWNSSFLEIENNFTSMSEFYDDGIDLIPKYFIRSKGLIMANAMYPFEIVPIVIAVPEALPYSEFSAYLRTITSDQLFSFAFFSIAAVMLLLFIFRYIKYKFFLFFQSVADVVNLLMNDNSSIQYQRLTCIEVFIIVPLTFVGFVVVNGILSNLQSHLTRPIIQPQINTIEEIYRLPYPMITWLDDWKGDLIDSLNEISKHNDWSDKIETVEWYQFEQNAEKFNRSITLFIDLNYANMLLRVQKQLQIKGFYILRKEIFKYFASYIANTEFPFIERLNEIVLWIQSAGLFNLWKRQHFRIVENRALENYVRSQDSDSGTFPLPKLIIYGWIASSFVFFVEIIYSHFKVSVNKTILNIVASFQRFYMRCMRGIVHRDVDQHVSTFDSGQSYVF